MPNTNPKPMADPQRTVDPLAILANLGRALALADHLGDVSENIARAWKLAGLGDLPEAEGGEPIGDGCEGTYDCGDLMPAEIERLHGVHGLWRSREYDVELRWVDDGGYANEVVAHVKADSPMDAARVAYHEACDENSAFTLGYADAVVDGERFELQPVTCVRVVRK